MAVQYSNAKKLDSCVNGTN